MGTPSDDSQLTFRALEHLVEHGGWDFDSLATVFASRRIFGLGRTVQEWKIFGLGRTLQNGASSSSRRRRRLALGCRSMSGVAGDVGGAVDARRACPSQTGESFQRPRTGGVPHHHVGLRGRVSTL